MTMSPAAPALSWTNLVSGFSSRHPLHEPFSGSLSTPGIYAVMGQNGCGKSTLLKTWLGLQKPLGGEVRLLGSTLKSTGQPLPGVGYVPQFHSVNRWFHIAVEDFVRLGFGPNITPTAETEQAVDENLVKWQLDGHRRRSFHELSLGQKTRALIARSLVVKPRLLFLDEPLASLDICCQYSLFEELQNLSSSSQMVSVMIDHHFQGFEESLTGRLEFFRAHDSDLSRILVEEGRA